MKAILQHGFGAPEVLKLGDVDRPLVTDDGVLVRVRAAAVNPLDWHYMRGKPYIARMEFGFLRPKSELVGVDFAGTVESVGKNVKQFRPGDEVFGGRSGAFAEYLCVPEDKAVVFKPPKLTFEEAAAVPVAAVTALQALRDQGHVQPGQKVLINGASGGVGTFAVQIAKSFGAEVTGVCSTKNVGIARSIGADHVIDYTREDFTRSDQRYDLMLDIAGSRSWSECRRVLKPQATLVIAGGTGTNRWLGPLAHSVGVRFASVGGSQKVVALFLAKLGKADLIVLQELFEAGKLRPVIDRTYPLSETPEAIRYLEEGHARGKSSSPCEVGPRHRASIADINLPCGGRPKALNGLLALFRHKTWATLLLIEYCQDLADEHLDATTPGTLGTIRETLRHLVEAEEGYYSIVTREPFPSKDVAEAFVFPDPLPDGPVPLDELAERIRRLGPRWEVLAQDADLQAREVTTTDGWRLPAALVMAQAIHHADDHRSHILSILGARGVPLPEPNGLDVWGYAESAGLMQEL
jgi:NADPH:quinone reductase-like Zn-dependent oxidoreductase/uncharacterized damage-inducible protein DinB